uniref:FAD synthase n=1 Tax=Trepomonas sp. PC1 TaxID=1076344 RepID=A0A146KBG9_9EUKA|eukprot:JAP93055.1 Phosphoadenosine phosphosulfate reductase family protein [Trepomonas sp. PC1]
MTQQTKIEDLESFYGHFMEKPPLACSYKIDDKFRKTDYGDCNRILQFVQNNETHPLSVAITEALSLIRQFLRKEPKVALSFNGGKDATVVMHLVRCACVMQTEYFHDQSPHEFFKEHIVPFVIHTDAQFKEVAQFFVWADDYFNLNTIVYQGNTFKECLQQFTVESGLKSCFLGVRSTDPTGKSAVALPTLGWPQLTRVSPILNWSFVDVFDFLLRFNVRYCSLYDRGFSSLGVLGKSFANPHLNSSLPKKTYQKKFFMKEYTNHIETTTTESEDFGSFNLNSGLKYLCPVPQSLEPVDIKTDLSERQELVVDELKKRGITDEMINCHLNDDEASSPAIFLPLSESGFDRRGRQQEIQ